jgi:hypothetical protein
MIVNLSLCLKFMVKDNEPSEEIRTVDEIKMREGFELS